MPVARHELEMLADGEEPLSALAQVGPAWPAAPKFVPRRQQRPTVVLSTCAIATVVTAGCLCAAGFIAPKAARPATPDAAGSLGSSVDDSETPPVTERTSSQPPVDVPSARSFCDLSSDGRPARCLFFDPATAYYMYPTTGVHTELGTYGVLSPLSPDAYESCAAHLFCPFENDGQCDEPATGTGTCDSGTDGDDCQSRTGMNSRAAGVGPASSKDRPACSALRNRLSADLELLPSGPIPWYARDTRCDENGQFLPVQHWLSVGSSWCADVHTGRAIPGTIIGPREPRLSPEACINLADPPEGTLREGDTCETPKFALASESTLASELIISYPQSQALGDWFTHCRTKPGGYCPTCANGLVCTDRYSASDHEKGTCRPITSRKSFANGCYEMRYGRRQFTEDPVFDKMQVVQVRQQICLELCLWILILKEAPLMHCFVRAGCADWDTDKCTGA